MRPSNSRSVLRFFAFAVLPWFLSCVCFGQYFHFETQREPVMSLDGMWRFHTGDDPRWADPSFDDRNWSLLHSDRDWAKQGYKGYSGFGWYRAHVDGWTRRDGALLLSQVGGSYQAFANGQLIGAFGQMPPHLKLFFPHPTFFKIPGQNRPASGLTLAIRVWCNPAEFGACKLTSKNDFFGEDNSVKGKLRSSQLEGAWFSNASVFLAILEGIISIAALGLFQSNRSENEILWFALMELFRSAWRFFIVYTSFVAIPWRVQQVVATILFSSADLFTAFFFHRFFREPSRATFWIVPVSMSLVSAFIMLSPSSHNASGAREIIFGIWFIWIAWRGVRRHTPDARVLFIPVLINNWVWIQGTLAQQLIRFGVPVPAFFQVFRGFGLDLGSFELRPLPLTAMVFDCAVLAVLIARFARLRGFEERRAREVEQARIVQHLLVPEQLPSIPGFSIASAYQPAQQVGGDFFQIIPVNKGALVAIGDVSGKGLPAAMTVSLIVGVLRMLAEQTESPSEILQGLNRRLVGSSQGFTTCLIAFLSFDGDGLIANAGHLAPYRNGIEVDTASHLPLGLTPEVLYINSPLALSPGDRLTLVSDGVVEAKNTKGELFGFDRTRLNSMRSADDIVSAATQFGQEDDITVLTIEYLAPATSLVN